MKATKIFALASVLAMASYTPTTAFAGAATDDNVKMHCVILKNGKVVHKQNCIADGYQHGNMYGAGEGYDFNPIKGYGKISVDSSTTVLTDKNDNPITDARGFNKMVSSDTMNDKAAIIQYRTPKNFKLLKNYEGGLIGGQEPYRCYIHKTKPKFEFCFRHR